VAHDSADVWAHRDLFVLDQDGGPAFVAGVPPDYFSATGQRWGNPLYDWERLAATGYRWWIERFRAILDLVDAVRLDHFRGSRPREVPAGDAGATRGRWWRGRATVLRQVAAASEGCRS
jgi:4-alpha-glucanotransferase